MIPLAFGVGSALTALVGGAVGAGDWVTARRTAWAGALLALAVAGAVGAAGGPAPETLPASSPRTPKSPASRARALSWVAPAFGGFGLGMALYFASMGAGRMGWPMAAGVACIALRRRWRLALANMVSRHGSGRALPGAALGISAYGVVTALGVRGCQLVRTPGPTGLTGRIARIARIASALHHARRRPARRPRTSAGTAGHPPPSDLYKAAAPLSTSTWPWIAASWVSNSSCALVTLEIAGVATLVGASAWSAYTVRLRS
ncbi:MATE family efflux transporter [Cupriavidus basilensis]